METPRYFMDREFSILTDGNSFRNTQHEQEKETDVFEACCCVSSAADSSERNLLEDSARRFTRPRR